MALRFLDIVVARTVTNMWDVVSTRPHAACRAAKKGSAESALSTEAFPASTHDPQTYLALQNENRRSLLRELYRKVVGAPVPCAGVGRSCAFEKNLSSLGSLSSLLLGHVLCRKKSGAASLQPADPREGRACRTKLAPLASRIPPLSTDDVFLWAQC